MPQVLRTAQAEQDLVEALTYVGRYSPAAADRLAEAIEQRCRLLAQFPEMGTLREELAPGLRSFVVGKYVLFYQPIAEGILLIRVLHGARDIPSLFSP